ncbi:MAG: DUF4058 family protein [Gemmataceae bacterium]|nr:DUF4058 family protein [Gemmataceae bacterium]
MKSPFPGMDPYIEPSGLWEDFHDNLVALIQQHLADTKPPGFYVRSGSRSYIEMVEQEGKRKRPFKPDVGLHSRRKPSKPPRSGRLAMAEPLAPEAPIELRAFIAEEHREKFVEIYEGAIDPRLVTAIEVLSPANKTSGSAGRAEYLRKRQSLMLGHVNLVELDLLRGGERMPMLDPWPDSPYVLMVARRSSDHHCQVWRAGTRTPLPDLPVPLTEGVPDLSIDLQRMADTVYRRGDYHEVLDYSKPLASPLAEGDPTPKKEKRR